ncbi:MAG: RES domain-containing protein [Acidobacteria bacterium]|nr:RES domain-containing protein [Acidobacteriota bacterium]
MTRVYRILRKRYAKNSFDGEGSFLFGGRWSSPGTRIAYAAEHLSLAMLEYFVHINADDPPKDLVVAGADIPDSVSRMILKPHDLPTDWRQVPASPALAAIGDSFIAERKVAVLILPSALVPSESIWLINPLHPQFVNQFVNIRVRSPEPL